MVMELIQILIGSEDLVFMVLEGFNVACLLDLRRGSERHISSFASIRSNPVHKTGMERQQLAAISRLRMCTQLFH